MSEKNNSFDFSSLGDDLGLEGDEKKSENENEFNDDTTKEESSGGMFSKKADDNESSSVSTDLGDLESQLSSDEAGSKADFSELSDSIDDVPEENIEENSVDSHTDVNKEEELKSFVDGISGEDGDNGNVEKEKIDFNFLKKKLLLFYSEIKNNIKYLFYVLLAILSILIVISFSYGYFAYQNYLNMHDMESQILEVDGDLEASIDVRDRFLEFLDDEGQHSRSIEYLAELYNHTYSERERLENILSEMKNPDYKFMDNLFLPSINIWKDTYTGELTDELMGQDYMELNNFIDTNLLVNWSDFFSNMGEDFPDNDITTISIGEVEPIDNDKFSIGIQVDFEAPDRRNFLMLIDKLSMTSNERNIGLINEFVYNMFLVIKDKREDYIDEIKEDGVIEDTDYYDDEYDFISHEIYELILDFNDEDSDNSDIENSELIDSDIIRATINSSVGCDYDAECFYEFRDRYRSIPNLAYPLGDDLIEDEQLVDEFFKFFSNLQPIINLNDFDFRKVEESRSEPAHYVGSFNIDFFGTYMDDEEVEEIESFLGQKCIGEDEFGHESGIDLVEDRLESHSHGDIDLDSSELNDLNDLENIFNEIGSEFSGLPNHMKAKRYFEIYRMLYDGNLCD